MEEQDLRYFSLLINICGLFFGYASEVILYDLYIHVLCSERGVCRRSVLSAAASWEREAGS